METRGFERLERRLYSKSRCWWTVERETLGQWEPFPSRLSCSRQGKISKGGSEEHIKWRNRSQFAPRFRILLAKKISYPPVTMFTSGFDSTLFRQPEASGECTAKGCSDALTSSMRAHRRPRSFDKASGISASPVPQASKFEMRGEAAHDVIKLRKLDSLIFLLAKQSK